MPPGTIVKNTILCIATAGLLGGSALAGSPATAPATAPATQPAAAANRAAVLNGLNINGNFGNRSFDAQRRRFISQQQSLEALPITATRKLDELLQLSLADGLLQTEVIPTDLPAGQSRFNIEGSTAMWVAQIQTVGFPAGRYVNISRYDFEQTEEGQIWSVSLHRGDGYLSINTQGLGASITFHQSNGVVMLVLTQFVNGRNRPVSRFDAPNLLQLQADHPEEVRQYLLPALSRLGGGEVLRVGAADVYAVFAELPPSSAVTEKLMRQLQRLDSDVFRERNDASAELANLGRAGIQAALRLDREALSFEQNDRIDALIDRERHRLIGDPAALRHDVSFLLECLEDVDTAVRVAAKSELEKTAGHALDFNAQGEAKERATAVEALQVMLKQEKDAKTIAPATQSATQPVTQPC